MKKRIVAWVMVLVMALSLVPFTNFEAEAATNTISLGNAHWITTDVSYHFPNATASFEEAQKIFCISVDNGGAFTIPDKSMLGTGSDIKISGLMIDTDSTKKYVDEPGITAGSTRLFSLTVTSKTSSIEQIQNFVRGITFYRNGVSATTKQKITVVSNSITLEDGMTVIAADGKIHYYKYVPWDYSTTVDMTRNWYTAYSSAKSTSYNGLKGYLATITSDIEQIYICNSVGLGSKGAWVGGARTKTTTSGGTAIGFDTNAISQLNPGQRESGKMADTWYWMCGPEAGRSYYKMTDPYYYGSGSSVGCDESYNYWYTDEPNNTDKSSEDDFAQEYCMEYGYDTNGEWNDLWPMDGTDTNKKWKMDGYLIEYSPYTNTKVAPEEPYVEDTKSSTDVKLIPEVMEAENPSVKAKDFIVTKTDAASSNESNIKDWADVSGTDAAGNAVGKSTITSDTATLNGVTEKKDITFTNPVGSVTTTVTAYVVDKVEKGTGEKAGITIGANDFEITREQEENRNTPDGKEVIKELAKAVAVDSGITVPTEEIELKSMVLNDTGAYYDVTFAYGGVEVTVKAKVSIPYIKANDFIVTNEQASSTNGTQVKDYAEVEAYKGTKVSPVEVSRADVTVENSNHSEPTSISDGEVFTFTNSQGTPTVTDTAKAYVVDKKADGTGEKTGITIGANTFVITSEQEANRNTAEVRETFKELAKVVATDLSAGENAIPYTSEDITVKEVKNTATAGVYDVTFDYKGVTVTVQAIVAEVTADDFIISVEDAKQSDSSTIKDLANAAAKDTNGSTVARGDIGTTPSNLQDVTEPGKKDITFKTPGGISTTATATIVDKTTKDVVSDGSTVRIGGNDFSISLEQAANKDSLATLFKNLAGAVATKDTTSGVHTNVERSDISIDTSSIQAKNGVYPVTLTYEGVSVTVNATVKSEGITTPADQTPAKNITGNDFTVPAKGEQLTQDSFKEKGNVSAKDSDGATVGTIVDASELEKVNQAIQNGQKGEYPVTVKTEDGTASTVIVVTVEDKSESNPATGETIAANNFVIGTEDYDLVTGSNKLSNTIKLANAVAYDTVTKAPVAIVDVDTSKVQNVPGTYEVTFKTAQGTSTTVTVTINADWKTVGDVDKASESNKKSDTTSNPTAVKNTPSDTVGAEQIFEKTNPKDIQETIASSKAVEKVTVDGKDISSSDYTVTGDKIVIKKSVFSNFAANTAHPIQVIYKDGSKHTFSVKVIDYNEKTVIKKVPILKMKKNMGVKTKFTLNLVGIDKTAKKIYKSTNKKVATINSKGVITAKKPGKTVITAYVIQKGSYYKVKVTVTVKKEKIKLYNLKKAALSKKSGELPEFNVYKRVFKGKKTKLKFTNVEKNAKISYKSSNKKIATVTKKGVIQGKKKGFTVVTAKIQQNGKTYVTRIFVRVDDNTTNKSISKYLK
ncbi:MAG: bacterial Ig-like domain-containing protein [Lachnospiraceae bacterium]|nr:bacterial Ig-like domain-containing protein [Lachnospiraceae bacterium]